MVCELVQRLRCQVSALVISANRNAETYMRLGRCPVVGDAVGDYAGPLAGIASAMAAARTPYLATVPCDAPLVSERLVTTLYQALLAAQAEISVARDAQRVQPMFAVLRCDLLPRLLAWLNTGGRQVRLWYQEQETIYVTFAGREQRFYNVNCPADRARLNSLWPPAILEHPIGEDE